jgi:hypothetical protein
MTASAPITSTRRSRKDTTMRTTARAAALTALTTLTGLTASLAAGLVLHGPAAHADPQQETLPMTCSDGRTLLISPAPANGTFTPDFDTASTAHFQPLRITVDKTVLGPDGAVLSHEEQTSTLGQGRQLQRRDVVGCAVSETLTSAEDPGIPAGTSLVVEVEMQGVFTPRS